MKTILFIALGVSFSVSSYAGVFKSKNDQGESANVQVMVMPGKTAKTYNPKTGEEKEIKPKVNVKSEK